MANYSRAVRASSAVCGAVPLLVCVALSTGCGPGGSKERGEAAVNVPVQDRGARRSAEAQIRGRVLGDMRSHANPIDGPPFRVTASCLTQTGRGSSYVLNCRATGYGRPKAVRDVSGVPISLRIGSELWSAGVENGRVTALRRARGQSIGRTMMRDYDSLCGGGSVSSGDPACH
jgi:hypothetical protein